MNIQLRPEAQERLRIARVIAARLPNQDAVSLERAHILPARDITFAARDGSAVELEMGDPEYRGRQVARMRAVIDAAGPTLVPMRLDHNPGAVGHIIDVVETDRGVDVIHLCHDRELLAARPYSSGRYVITLTGDGWEIDRLREVTLCDEPQFGAGQEPVSQIDVAARVVEDARREIWASIGAAHGDDSMTPEEIQELVAGMVAEAVPAAVKAALEEIQAMEPPAAETEPEVEAAEVEDEPETVDVAASVTAAVKAAVAPLNAEIARLKRTVEVRASFADQQFDPPAADAPDMSTFGGRVVHYRNSGMSKADAVEAARTHKG